MSSPTPLLSTVKACRRATVECLTFHRVPAGGWLNCYISCFVTQLGAAPLSWGSRISDTQAAILTWLHSTESQKHIPALGIERFWALNLHFWALKMGRKRIVQALLTEPKGWPSFGTLRLISLFLFYFGHKFDHTPLCNFSLAATTSWMRISNARRWLEGRGGCNDPAFLLSSQTSLSVPCYTE